MAPKHRECLWDPALEGQELEQVRCQVVQLGAAPLASKLCLDALAQSPIYLLSDEGSQLALGLRADALVGQPRGDRVGGRHDSGLQIDLDVEVETVDIVVHRMEEVQARSRAHEPHNPLAPKDSSRARRRAV